MTAPVPALAASRTRFAVLAFGVALAGVTYLDRVCISVAGPRMQEELHIGPIGWGWVTGVFTISYCLFEIPTGILGDRIGPRRVLTRIVLWWSAFTAMTGAVTSYYPLLVARFLFGAGEAGARFMSCAAGRREARSLRCWGERIRRRPADSRVLRYDEQLTHLRWLNGRGR